MCAHTLACRNVSSGVAPFVASLLTLVCFCIASRATAQTTTNHFSQFALDTTNASQAKSNVNVETVRKEAEAGDSVAQFDIGVRFWTGNGVPKDYSEAVRWWRKAADQANLSAQYNLGWCYYFGEGVGTNYSEAVKWFREPAEYGHGKAQLGLGGCYANGRGVPEHHIEAYKWLNLAAAQGVEDAAKLRDLLATVMTPQQIAEGQRRASRFVARPAHQAGY
jgi:TPR repeat protein